MALRNSSPMKWMPRGVSDTLDATNSFTGAMRTLQNLIRDPTTLGIWVCRPAAIQQTAFGGFPATGFVSWFEVIGNQIYGLVAGTTFAGRDLPFCYDFATGNFIAVTGATAANTPLSPAASGAWHPPIGALVGVKLVVTHPGFQGGATPFFGWFDVTNPAAPTWNAGNTATNALPTVPRSVFQFGNRAYFASGRYLVFTDVLDPLTVTNATQALTLGDNQPITALGGLPAGTLTGGIVQTLIVFKSESNPMQIYQVTGDATNVPSPLSINNFPVATGTLSPLSICSTPKGMAFLAPDGLRIIDFAIQVSDPLNIDGSGIAVPFLYAVEPSRVCAACNGNIMRISTQNGYAVGSPFEEYWFDFKYSQWSGPHTFPASLIKPYSDQFVMAPQSVLQKLFTSDVRQKSTSTYVENGAQLSFIWQTPMLPNKDTMSEYNMIETTVDIAYPPTQLAFVASCGDENNTLFDSVSLLPSGNPTLWGSFNWGQAPWLGAANALTARQLPWHQPITFQRIYVGLSGDCSGALKIGSLRMRYEELGYLLQIPAA
jgi:hypothetical protein